ncbi:hypothetical protein J6590_104486 [Homalodisca vitripennis]|nr:hypothetical protein J6590_104486 [Homalodisca vitripennis]
MRVCYVSSISCHSAPQLLIYEVLQATILLLLTLTPNHKRDLADSHSKVCESAMSAPLAVTRPPNPYSRGLLRHSAPQLLITRCCRPQPAPADSHSKVCESAMSAPLVVTRPPNS